MPHDRQHETPAVRSALIAGRRAATGSTAVLLNEPSPELYDAIRRSFPKAAILVVGADLPTDPRGAIAVARRQAWDTVVVGQTQRKLEVLAFAMRTRGRFVVKDGALEPLGAGELVLHQARLTPMAGPFVHGVLKRVGRRVERIRHAVYRPKGISLDNDFSALAAEVNRLPIDWPRLRLSVVMPVYNRRAILAKTVAALRHQTYPAELFELVIADDGSSDHPETIVDDHRGALSIRVVRQDDLGFRAARVRNLGMQSATGEVIVLLDCDMLPEPELLAMHAKWFHVTTLPLVTIGMRRFVSTDELSAADIQRDPMIVARLPERLAPSAIRDAARPTTDWRTPFFEATDDLRRDPFGYRFAASGNLAFRKRDAITAGMFDESYERWGGEDIEFAYRLHRQGSLFIGARDAMAYHQEHAEAVVREEHAEITRVMTRSKIPALRREEPGERFDVPKVAIIIVADRAPQRTLDSARAQDRVSTEVYVGTTRAEAIQAITAEYVLEVPPGEHVPADAAALMVTVLEKEPLTSLVTAPGATMFRVRDYHRLCHLEGREPADLARALARHGRHRVID